MKKYWYAAITADGNETVVSSDRTLTKLGENLGLGTHVINYYYQRSLVNKKLNIRIIRVSSPEYKDYLKRMAERAKTS